MTDYGPPPPAPSRVNYRRVALISLGALAVAGAATVGVLQLLPRGHEAATPAGTPTPSAAETSAEATPSGSAGLSAAPPGAAPGTLVYLTHTGGGPLAVTTVSAGTPRTTAFGAARADEYVAVAAPDATKVVVISPSDPNTLKPGDLVLVSPGGGRRVLAHGAAWGGGIWPLWTIDSTKVMVKLGSAWNLVDVASGAAAPLPGVDGQYFAWSASGAFRAFTPDESKVVVTRADGSVVSQAPLGGLPECNQTAACPFAVQGVSDDGRFVALGHGNTDPQHVNEAHLVLDMRTGKPVTLSTVPGQVDRIFFRPGGGMLLRSSRGGKPVFSIVGANGRVTDTVPQPDALAQADLVAYRT